MNKVWLLCLRKGTVLMGTTRAVNYCAGDAPEEYLKMYENVDAIEETPQGFIIRGLKVKGAKRDVGISSSVVTHWEYKREAVKVEARK